MAGTKLIEPIFSCVELAKSEKELHIIVKFLIRCTFLVLNRDVNIPAYDKFESKFYELISYF